jgi:hypothetical protein
MVGPALRENTTRNVPRASPGRAQRLHDQVDDAGGHARRRLRPPDLEARAVLRRVLHDNVVHHQERAPRQSGSSAGSARSGGAKAERTPDPTSLAAHYLSLAPPDGRSPGRLSRSPASGRSCGRLRTIAPSITCPFGSTTVSRWIPGPSGARTAAENRPFGPTVARWITCPSQAIATTLPGTWFRPASWIVPPIGTAPPLLPRPVITSRYGLSAVGEARARVEAELG